MSDALQNFLIGVLAITVVMLLDLIAWTHGRMLTKGPSPRWSFLPGGGFLRVLLGK